MKAKRILAGLLAAVMIAGTALVPNGGTALNLVASAEEGVAINATNFPDANFRAYVTRTFDKDGNGALSDEEIAAANKISINDDEIESLKGVEYFTALTYLDCGINQLTSLDVSKNAALIELDCSWNQLTSLDVSNNIALESLSCGYNELTSLDVSNNIALESLSCGYNELSSLDISKNTVLTGLECYGIQLTSLDVSNNIALKYLWCYNNHLTSLDISKNTMLTLLSCFNNQLTSLDLSKNTALESLYCGSNPLTSINISKNTKLSTLSTDKTITIYGIKGTYPETYAKKNEIKFIDVNENPIPEGVTVYRLYNPVNLEHLYTTDTNEVRVLAADYGWNYEGSAWSAPKGGIPVYRLYCSATNAHLYTTDTNERDTLLQNPVWSIDNGGEPLFYSDAAETKAIYRLYNEGIQRHMLTTNKDEYDLLSVNGWNGEGVKLYCVELGNSEEKMP